MKRRLLDLFCGAGGCTKGYEEAGFEVVGVDIESQPHYCGSEFVQADATEILGSIGRFRRWVPEGEDHLRLDNFDAIHASPPCQAYSGMSKRWSDREHPELVPVVREELQRIGLPWVIENVPGAPLHEPTMLCGTAFGLPLKRHRLFETSFEMPVLGTPGCMHGAFPKRYRIRQHGKEFDTAFCYVFGGGQAGQPVAAWREAMGIDWMTVDELSQAIPPAFTRHIGEQLLSHLEAHPLETEALK